jgi:hypothetical protein
MIGTARSRQFTGRIVTILVKLDAAKIDIA